MRLYSSDMSKQKENPFPEAPREREGGKRRKARLDETAQSIVADLNVDSTLLSCFSFLCPHLLALLLLLASNLTERRHSLTPHPTHQSDRHTYPDPAAARKGAGGWLALNRPPPPPPSSPPSRHAPPTSFQLPPPHDFSDTFSYLSMSRILSKISLLLVSWISPARMYSSRIEYTCARQQQYTTARHSQVSARWCSRST